jgi:Ca2+-binding RTX toxin-like protein
MDTWTTAALSRLALAAVLGAGLAVAITASSGAGGIHECAANGDATTITDATYYDEPGAHTIQAGTSENTIYARDGADVVCAYIGDDTVYGGRGGDTLYGEADNDHLLGGRGIDLLNGGTGKDVCRGGKPHPNSGPDPDAARNCETRSGT